MKVIEVCLSAREVTTLKEMLRWRYTNADAAWDGPKNVARNEDYFRLYYQPQVYYYFNEQTTLPWYFKFENDDYAMMFKMRWGGKVEIK